MIFDENVEEEVGYLDANDVQFAEDESYINNKPAGDTEWALRTQAASDNWDRTRAELYDFLMRKDDPLAACICSESCVTQVHCVTLRGEHFFILVVN